MSSLRCHPGTCRPGSRPAESVIKAKTAASGAALFFRAVLCNFLVCLAVWMAARTTSDGAKIMLIFWGILAFVRPASSMWWPT
ncbi:hypothetical protein E4K10_39870 [Streptomyces sp. T1317-0309]|nr:hypothetical protein E4K10_39870 [Streptomyces sp. T1317-0309]